METVVALFLILNVVLIIVLAFETYFYRRVNEEYEHVVEGLVETIQVVNANAIRQEAQELVIADLQEKLSGGKDKAVPTVER